MQFGDLVPNPDLLMGVKAVFGPLHSHLLCFGGRGTPNEPRYYSIPRSAASKAQTSPYVITIGGGTRVRDNLGGKVLNIAKASTVFGNTATLAEPGEAVRLAQWPVALVLHDVWNFDGFPHLVEDLGLPDRTILAAAMDGIIRPAEKVVQLWKELQNCEISLQNLPLPANFIAPETPLFVSDSLPTIIDGTGSEEGARIWEMQLRTERSRKLSQAAKALNQVKHGSPTCESCGFKHSDTGMFDAHHPTPLAVGQRTTLAEHLIVLCPTCHRRAHRIDKLVPQTLAQLKLWVELGRP